MAQQRPFLSVSGAAAALPMANIDTDVIMPKKFLKGIDRSGLAEGLFHDLRFDEHTTLRRGFVLNDPDYRNVRFLIAGPNFGCGSSREHAVWGLLQYGIRAIIGTTFAGIFTDNAANNGLLLVSLDDASLARLLQTAAAGPVELTIDLESQTLQTPNEEINFAIDAAIRRSLMLGMDQIDETLASADQIRRFEDLYFIDHPWLRFGGR